MSRQGALSSVSALALWAVLSGVPSTGNAQTPSQALPPVNVDAPREARIRPAAPKQRIRSSSAQRTRTTPAAAVTVSTTPAPAGNVTPSAARTNLNQSPNGQTATTIDRSQFDNPPSLSVAAPLRPPPPISLNHPNPPPPFRPSPPRPHPPPPPSSPP